MNRSCSCDAALVDELFLALEDFDFTHSFDGGFEYEECDTQVHRKMVLTLTEVDTATLLIARDVCFNQKLT